MIIEKILTDENIDHVIDSFDVGRSLEEFVRAIEQAVLQSPEVQRLRKDAGRYRFLRGHELGDFADTTPWISAAKNDDERWGLNGEVADSRIDAAMKEQP